MGKASGRKKMRRMDLLGSKAGEKLSPYTGEVMSFQGEVSVSEFLEQSRGHVVGVDLIRGKPVEHILSVSELERLKALSDG